ncbi:MAG TPA: alpha/beta hydrolase [Jatrophihabitans sp.]|nr:alpha/beta hydrolase [Jatrophihabitans sp.]
MPSPTIVLLHGQPDSSASFWALRRALAERLPGVRVLAPDRPGYGANPAPATDFAGNVGWLRHWLAELPVGPIVLVGHSWAGGVALLAVADTPGSAVPARSGSDGRAQSGALTGLVLLASIGPSCLLPIDRVLAAPVLGEAIAYATLRLGQPWVARKARSLIIGGLAAVDHPYALASGLAMRARPVWRSFLTEQRALLRELPAITDSVGRISVPTQLINGNADQLIPGRTAQALRAGIPQASSARIDGGHDLQLRQPVQVAELVADFARPLLAVR